MKIIDISWPIAPNCTAYKDRKTISFTSTKNFAQDKARESLITFSSHSGTHIDAPSHFLEHGKTIDQINLESLVGPCRVLDFTGSNESITQKDLEKHAIKKNEIILLKTKNSALADDALFNPHFVYLDKTGAEYFADIGIKTVGIDYLGIERNQPNHETHITLLQNNITIIEGLRLSKVNPGPYQLFCLPLAIIGLDGAPARALLIPD